MIIGTGGSRIVRRRTLLEVSKSPTTEDKKKDFRPSTEEGRARSNSDCTAQTKPRSVKMKTFEPTVGRATSSNKEVHEKGKNVKDGVKVDGFKSAWTNIVNIEDVKTIARTQKQTLRKFEETNEMLHQFNNLSDLTFIEIQSCYKTHVAVLSALKDDLDNIFYRVRSLKGKLKEQYPDAFTATSDAIETLKERQRMAMEVDPFQDTNLYATAKLPDYTEAPSVPVPVDSEFSIVPFPMASGENEHEKDSSRLELPGAKQSDDKLNDSDIEIVNSNIEINPVSEQEMVVEMNVLSLDSVENEDVKLVQCDENKATACAENIANEQEEFSETREIENAELSKHDLVQDDSNFFGKDRDENNEDPTENKFMVSNAAEETLCHSEDLANGDLNCMTNVEENEDAVPIESDITACSDLADKDIKIEETLDGDSEQTSEISNNILPENSIEKPTNHSNTIDSSKEEDRIASDLTNLNSRMEDSS